MKELKKIFTLIAMFTLLVASCKTPLDEDGPNTPALPKLIIKNESSYVLNGVTFSGISFAATGSAGLPPSSQAVKELSGDDVNKAGYITFVRADIGIACRTDQAITVSGEDFTFTFTDQTVAVEQANTNNKKTLDQITFISNLVIEYGGLSIDRNETVNLGESVINIPKQTEFVLKNTGVGKLLLNGSEPVKINGIDAGTVFLAVQPTSSEIAPNATLSFRINFNPQAAQAYNGTITVSTNDPSGNFSFTVSGTGVAPKPVTSLWYETTEIAQNGTINAGEVLISQSKNIEVTLKNTGLQTLVIDTANITLGGAEASAFSIISNPGANISAGEQSQFIIQCAPTKQGENNAILTIPTNDSSRNPAVAYLKVTGIQGSALLELTTQENTTIANNAITPFDFGQVEVGTYKNFVFTIKNKGNIPLELTGAAAVESSGAVFTVPAQPGSRIIAPGSTVPFVMRYTPAEEREDTATITILNNSSDLQFTFTVKGTGFIQKPQISVKQGAAVLDAHEVFDFGTIAAGKTKDFTFTIENTGEANLTFVTENNNRINLADNAAGLFSVVYQPSASTTVTPGGSASFTLRFSPAAQGNNFTATVQIKTNSRDNDEFIFTVKGSARAAKTEARLSALQFTHGKLDQQFNANIFAYTLKVDAGLSLVNVTPTSIDADISDLVVNGWSQSSGSRSEDIILDSTGAVTVIVTAEDGTASQTYTVTINRIVNYSSAALASLYVSNMAGSDEGNVLDSLNAYNTAYWDALPDETQLKFKITPLNSNATVKVNDSTITNGVYTGGYALDPGAAVSTFTLTVISEDGDNQRTISLKSSYLGSQWERVGAFPAGGLDDWWEALPSVVVHNNQFVLTNKDEVFLSTNGTSWTKTYTYPEEIMHPWCSTVLFNNTIYNIGGYKLNVAGDTYEAAPLVSYSTNGTIWTNPAVTGLTNGVSHQASVVFNNAIYTMGGTTKTLIQTNAVWRSTNGTAWTQLNAPGWGARAGHASVVFNNKIFVMGGFYNDGASEYRDVWSSGNGTTWTRETASAAWTGRNDHTVNVNGKGMWLAGGNDGFYKNDVWFSRNGKDWVQVLQNAPFGVRAYHAAVVKDGYLYIFGGITGDLEDNISNLYDIWRTYIGE